MSAHAAKPGDKPKDEAKGGGPGTDNKLNSQDLEGDARTNPGGPTRAPTAAESYLGTMDAIAAGAKKLIDAGVGSAVAGELAAKVYLGQLRD
jgi:hypothetical protein